MEKGSVQVGAAGRYRIVDELGEGGFGTTYLAERESDGRQVVAKYLQMHRVPDWKSVELFDREAEVLQKLSHPRIPGYIDHGSPEKSHAGEDGAFFIVQEYVDGQPIDQALRAREAFDHAWVTTIVRDLLGVLEYLHGRTPPVIHRDVKPSNVLVDAAGRAHLIDFGAVRAVFESEGSTTTGTYGYAAPEQFVGRASAASDLYGLGMTALTALTGMSPEELPFKGNRVDVDAALPAGSVPPRLKRALAKMTEPNPDDRPSSAAEVARRLAGAEVSGDRLQTDEVDTQAIQVWYDALYRLDRCEPLDMNPTWFERSVMYARFDAAGRWAFLYSPMRTDLLRLSDLSVYELEHTPGETFAGFSPGGETLVVLDRGRGDVSFYDLDDGEFTPTRRQTSVYDGDFSSFDLEVRVGPDGETAAAWSTFESNLVRLIERTTGRVFQTLKAEDIDDVAFAPDSSAIVVCADYELHIYGRDGSHRRVPGQRVAFSADGRFEAIVHSSKIEVRRVDGSYLADNEVVAEREAYVVRKVRWSADSSTLLTIEMSADRDGEFIITSGVDLDIRTVIDSAGRPIGISHVMDATVVRDGRTVWAAGVDFWTRFASDSYMGMAAFDTTTGVALGTYSHFIALADEDEQPANPNAAERPMFNASDGFVHIQPPVDGTNQHEAAKQLIRGETPSLTAEETLAWEDMRVRMAFVDDLFVFGELDKTDNPAPLVRASIGLTHLLPAALLRARQSGGARFGPTDGSGVTVDSLVRALEEIRTMPEGERKVVFEDSIEAIRREPLFGAQPEFDKPRALVPFSPEPLEESSGKSGAIEKRTTTEVESHRMSDTALGYAIMLFIAAIITWVVSLI